VVEALDPDLITYEALGLVFSVLQGYARKEGSIPDRATFQQLLLQRHHSGAVSGSVYKKARKAYKRAFREEPLSREDAKVVLTDAILDVETLAALDDGYKLYKDRKYDDVYSRMEDAQARTRLLDLGSLGASFRREKDEYIEELRSGESKVDRIPIGVDVFDKCIKGGLGRGELGCVLAPEKDGKSMALNHIAATAVLCGLKVVYISAELGKTILRHRYTANLTGLTVDALEEGGDKIADLADERLERIFDRTGGDCVFKVFPSKAATVRDIEAYLRDLQRLWGYKPDVLIVDYADELASGARNLDSSSTYLTLGQIYSELRALGAPPEDSSGVKGGFNCAVWTASQVQRNAIGNEVLEFKDVADSILKVAKVDLMVSLCRNEEEREVDVVRLYVSACRYAKFPQEVGPFARDYAHGRLVLFDRNARRFEEGTWQQQRKQRLRKRQPPNQQPRRKSEPRQSLRNPSRNQLWLPKPSWPVPRSTKVITEPPTNPSARILSIAMGAGSPTNW